MDNKVITCKSQHLKISILIDENTNGTFDAAALLDDCKIKYRNIETLKDAKLKVLDAIMELIEDRIIFEQAI